MSIGMTPLRVDLNTVPISPSLSEIMMYSPWAWGLPIRRVPIRKIEFPTSSPSQSSPELDGEQKRGRPRRSDITALKTKGAYSPSSIKCEYCHRVFPRQKSLLAHTRTHTGERPYVCDFEGCNRAFCQSGQLKTHKRLHTGEKPFQCSHEGCTSRFTHANRHCPAHPRAALKRKASADLTDEVKSPKVQKSHDENQPLDYSKASLTSSPDDLEYSSSFYDQEEDNAYLTPIRRIKNRRPLKPRVCIPEEPHGDMANILSPEKTPMTPSSIMNTPAGIALSSIIPPSAMVTPSSMIVKSSIITPTTAAAAYSPPAEVDEDPLAVQCALTLVEFSNGGKD